MKFLEPGAEVEKVGEESLLGAETTHYRAMVDVRGLVEHAPAQVQKAVGAAGMLQEAPHFPSTSGSTTPA